MLAAELERLGVADYEVCVMTGYTGTRIFIDKKGCLFDASQAGGRNA